MEYSCDTYAVSHSPTYGKRISKTYRKQTVDKFQQGRNLEGGGTYPGAVFMGFFSDAKQIKDKTKKSKLKRKFFDGQCTLLKIIRAPSLAGQINFHIAAL